LDGGIVEYAAFFVGVGFMEDQVFDYSSVDLDHVEMINCVPALERFDQYEISILFSAKIEVWIKGPRFGLRNIPGLVVIDRM